LRPHAAAGRVHADHPDHVPLFVLTAERERDKDTEEENRGHKGKNTITVVARIEGRRHRWCGRPAILTLVWPRDARARSTLSSVLQRLRGRFVFRVRALRLHVRRLCVLLCVPLLFVFVPAFVSLSQTLSAALGHISFPTSGAAAAQPPFVRGVLFLHSFEYDAAIDQFRQAQKIDPAFAMAY